MIAKPDVPLILGGHSFIRQLGSDPQATQDEQTEIVAACLDNGIRAKPAFAAANRLDWETLACSPFVRGWELDRLVEQTTADHDDHAGTRARLADHMLRYSLHAPHVDRLIVSMRKAEWVQANVASWRRGPLSNKERAWLKDRIAAR